MVECQLPKLDVAGSNPVSRSMFSISYAYCLIASNLLFEVNEVGQDSEVVEEPRLE